MSFLEISGLRKTYGDLVAVDDVGFAVNPGEIFGLLGPNGAGKSTTMMMLAGLIEPDAGRIRLDGTQLAPRDRLARRTMGVAPQDLAIYPNLTARENLKFYGRLYGVTGVKLSKQIANVLQLIGLTDRADDLIHTYSGGMKRRLNFGVALLHEPRLLILDEPTVGVDPQSRAHLMRCVRELCGAGVAVIYCSHYMEEVQELCDRVAIVDRGRVLVCDHIEHLLERVDCEVHLVVADVSAESLRRISDRDGVTVENGNSHPRVTISYSPDDDPHRLTEILTTAIAQIETAGGSLVRLDADEPDLERLFLKMTGSRLRD